MNKTRPRTAGVNSKNRPYLGPNNNNFNTSQSNFRRTFFIQEKEKGDPYFKSTRVGSCRKVVVKNGIPFALTFRVRNPRGEPMTHYKYTLKQKPKNPSTYQVDYCTNKVDYHLGMDNKPLVPYSATHKRSQLPEDLKFKVYKNISAFDIGNEGLVNRKQWVSTYTDSYRPIRVYHISNPGITSDLAKRTHYKFNNIEYRVRKNE